MDLLVLADRDGVVDMTHEAIARRTNRPISIIRETIAKLESPDAASRTPDDDGRRIKRLDEHRDWGWMITNYDRFRLIASDEQRREKTNARVSRYRAKVRGQKEGTPETKIPHHDLHADAYKAAFDVAFPAPYAWHEADFIQLARWRKQYPGVTTEEFVRIAQSLWAKGEYRPQSSLTIRGLCAAWAQAVAKATPKQPPAPTDDPLSLANGRELAERAAQGQANAG